MIELIAMLLVLAAAIGVFAWVKRPRPVRDDLPPLTTIDRFIKRFEKEAREATTQRNKDNAEGRLRYWRSVKAKT